MTSQHAPFPAGQAQASPRKSVTPVNPSAAERHTGVPASTTQGDNTGPAVPVITLEYVVAVWLIVIAIVIMNLNLLRVMSVCLLDIIHSFIVVFWTPFFVLYPSYSQRTSGPVRAW
ncbi:hypothetical protein EDD15DRAFT_186973 [Pisolithus albus]|nr:hypothetical protein EDD15DRAFT_186973 [Pisolithus albus]